MRLKGANLEDVKSLQVDLNFYCTNPSAQAQWLNGRQLCMAA